MELNPANFILFQESVVYAIRTAEICVFLLHSVYIDSGFFRCNLLENKDYAKRAKIKKRSDNRKW